MGSVKTNLPKIKLLKINETSISNGETRTSGWREVFDNSSVSGYFIADTAGAAANADLTIEQSLDKTKADITNTVSPTSNGSATPFEFDLVGDFVKVTFTANENIDEVRLTSFKSTRVTGI